MQEHYWRKPIHTCKRREGIFAAILLRSTGSQTPARTLSTKNGTTKISGQPSHFHTINSTKA